MKWIDYTMDSKYHEQPFIKSPKVGGKGFFKPRDKFVYLGGNLFTMPYVMPLLPPVKRYNSYRLGKERTFFN